MARYAMAIDTKRCVGCSDCVVACQTENDVPIGYCRDWIVEEMDGKYKADGKQCLITVDDLRDIDHPSREELGEEYREPEDQSAESDDSNTPENSQVVKLFPVGPSAVIGPGPFADKPFDGGHKIFDILPVEP